MTDTDTEPIRRAKLVTYQYCLSAVMDYGHPDHATRDAIYKAIAEKHDRTACLDCDDLGYRVEDGAHAHGNGRRIQCDHPGLSDSMRMATR